MIMEISHIVEDCPVCGRPVEIQSQYIGQDVACGHCRGRFVVYESNDGQLATASWRRSNLMERAERLLRHAAGAVNWDASANYRLGLRSSGRVARSWYDEKRQTASATDTQPEHEPEAKQRRSTALLVEHRDEVFARIATDMARTGMNVVRATSAVDALKRMATCEPTLVVVNLDLPDQSGWLLAGKLCFVDPHVRVWLYHPQSSADDEATAKYLQVDQLLGYGGDLLGLSETIGDLMSEWRGTSETLTGLKKSEEPTTA